MKTIELNNVSFNYSKNHEVFNNISFKLSPGYGGKVYCIMGNSGSGKSTLLKILLGLEKPYSGNVIIHPNNSVFSFVPQEPVLFEHLTPLENAMYFFRISNYKDKCDYNLFNEVKKILKLDTILESVRSINNLSGGEKQRICLLRSLSIKPDCLLLDEPLTGLDEEIKNKLLYKLLEIVKSYNIITIYVTHHWREVELIADYVLYVTKNEGEKCSYISNQSIVEFVKNPLTISAARIFESEGRLILFINSSNLNFLNSKELLSDCFILFTIENIEFTSQNGFEFEVLSSNNIVTVVSLFQGEQYLILPSQEFKVKNIYNFKCIKLKGFINIYNGSGFFLKKVYL